MSHIICRSYQKSDVEALALLLEPVKNRKGQTITLTQNQRHNTYLWIKSENLIGAVCLTPCNPYSAYWEQKPSQYLNVDFLSVLPGHNVRFLFRLFYRQFDWSSVRFPLILLGDPSTAKGLSFDSRLGFRHFWGNLWTLPISRKEKMPLF